MVKFKRSLARARERLEAYRRDRARSRRRRRRVEDWEKSNRRRPSTWMTKRVRRRNEGDRLTCGFCEAARGWVTGLCARLVNAVVAAGRGIASLVARARDTLGVDEGDREISVSSRVSRRRSYPGSRRRRFELHLPEGYNGGTARPLLMVLHGCRQTSADIRDISDFDAVADREGFIVVYPFVTGYSGLRIRNCWGWWIDSEIRPGAGEVEDLWQIIEQVSEEVSIDTRRIHIAGLSSGAGMAVAAMVAHADRIASGAAVAGIPYSETPRAVSHGAPGGVSFKRTELVVDAMRSVLGEHGRPSPIFIVHSRDDAVVDIQAARNLRDSWAQCYRLDPTRPVSENTGTTDGAAWVHARYRKTRQRSAIETLFIEGRGHGWYGGRPGKFSYPAAPNISELMWRFFKRHPLQVERRGAEKQAQLRKAG